MIQLLANILVAASMNALLGLSLYPGYHTTRFFNLAHAFLPTCAAYVLLAAASVLHLPVPLAALLGIGAACLTALGMETALFAPLRRHELASWQMMVASLGAYTVLINAFSILFGDETRSIGLASSRIEIFGASISHIRLLTIAAALIGFGFMIFLLQRTSLGRAIRAVGSNPTLAEIFGVSPARTAAWAAGLGGLYAGTAGVLTSLDTDMNPTMGFRLLINGVVTMILAGVGNVGGLLGGALLLATGQHLVAYYLDSKWMDAVAFLILIAFLIWKPLGFSGRLLKKVEI